MFEIYIMNLGKYNEGNLVGQWLTLPASDEEINNAMDAIGINELYEEYIVSDFVNNFEFEIMEHASIKELNEVAEYLQEFNEYERKLINALLEGDYICYKNLVDRNVDLYNYSYLELDNNTLLSDEASLAYAFIEEYYMENVQNMEYYFDFEKFANDLYYDFDIIIEGMDEEDKQELEELSRLEFADWYIEGFGGVEELSFQTLENYFDYKKFGRDLILNGAFISSNGIAII